MAQPIEEGVGWGHIAEEWRLCDAAMRGNVNTLNEIIVSDSYILDRVLVGSFKGKNPLHLAISTGQEGFVEELLTNKPELAKVLDRELGTALHVASAKGHVGIVKRLVEVSPGMCLTRDRDGNNPLHIAAMNGKVQVLNELLQTCPHAARVKVDRGDTILHLCINYNQPECLERLLILFGDRQFVNSVDINGNNIFHLAVFSRRLELVERVLNKTYKKIDVNATNGSGLTAMDIHSAIRGADAGSDTTIEDFLHSNGARLFVQLPPIPEAEPPWKRKRNSTLMVVSSLIATMAFLVGLTPPGGLWVDISEGDNSGRAIIAYKHPIAYSCLMFVNTVGFLASLTTILLLIIALPGKKQIDRWIRSVVSWLTIMTTAFAYTFSVYIVSPTVHHVRYVSIAVMVVVIVWAVVTSLVLLLLFIRNYSREPRSPRESIKKTSPIIPPRPLPDEASGSEQIRLTIHPSDEASESESNPIPHPDDASESEQIGPLIPHPDDASESEQIGPLIPHPDEASKNEQIRPSIPLPDEASRNEQIKLSIPLPDEANGSESNIV